MSTHVMIAGAGPTGLTLAVDLARRGIDLRIVDRSPQPATGVRARGLQPRTLEVFDDLEIIDEILSTGGEFLPVWGYDNDRVIWKGRIDERREPSPTRPYPNLIRQPQWRTERILRDRLAELGHQVEFGSELIGLEQDESGVTATLSTGERVSSAYLVGADGGGSFVRKQLGVGFAGETYESEHILLADVRTGDLDREHHHAWGLDDETRHLSFCPMPNSDDFQVIAAYEGTDDLAAVVASYAPWVRVEEVVWRSEYQVNVRMADRFRVGRVLLAGDAAHVHSPAGAQGLNTGVQDAYNLGWKLAAGSEALLDSYEAERMAVAAQVLGLSSRMHRGKNVVLGDDTDQLGLAYLGSPLSVGASAGRRLGTLFAEQRGTDFLLLGELTRDHGIRVLPQPAGREGVTLVRPDGYIGYHGDEHGLASYLSTFGITSAGS